MKFQKKIWLKRFDSLLVETFSHWTNKNTSHRIPSKISTENQTGIDVPSKKYQMTRDLSKKKDASKNFAYTVKICLSYKLIHR